MVKSLTERDRSSVWHPYTQMQTEDLAIPIVRAKGAKLRAEDGSTYIDAISSWWVSVHGHCHPRLVSALKAQAETLDHVIFAGFTHEPAVLLAESLLRVYPGSLGKVFYSDNGSTAVEVALKMALQFWKLSGSKRKRIVALDGAYHGDTFGAMAASSRSTFHRFFEDLLFEVAFIPFPEKGKEELSIKALEALLKADDVAAFIYEPLVQGAGGMRFYEPAILDQLLHKARAAGALCIADEVFTGFGRTGTLFAHDQLNEKPDLVALSKGLSGGMLPLGATLTSNVVYEKFLSDDRKDMFAHGHSFTANPLACRVAGESLKLLLEEESQLGLQRLYQAQASLAAELRDRFEDGSAESMGLILRTSFLAKSGSNYFSGQMKAIREFALQRGVLLRPLGDVLYTIPSLAFSEQDLADVSRVLIAALEHFSLISP